jgi:hypothetical protein
MTQEEKQRAHGLLAERFDDQQLSVFRIEERLGLYYQDLTKEPDYHNAYEILGALKFLRLLNTYEQDIETFRDVIYKYEGIWEQRDGIWHHVEGGLNTLAPRGRDTIACNHSKCSCSQVCSCSKCGLTQRQRWARAA